MYLNRTLEPLLVNSIKTRSKINILIGARQTGKTSLLKRIIEIIELPNLFIDLDIFENRQIFSSYTEVITYLKFNGYKTGEPLILFLDEFHTVHNIGKILKNLYDNNPEIKILATGSSSLEIISHLKESMAGRKRIYQLYPLSLEEFIDFKDAELAEKLKKIKKANIPLIIHEQLINYIKEFIIFGGYPEVVLCNNLEEKKEILGSIFDLFVKKDLIELLKIKNPQAALNILTYVSLNIGKLTNYSDLCATLQIDINTLKKYIQLLNETFIVKTISPYYTNKLKEIVKSPKIYFHDSGARNYFIKNFVPFDLRPDRSYLAENFVFNQLLKKKNDLSEIKYWRDKNGREIDFIVEEEQKLNAYEIKCKKRITSSDYSHLLFFKNEYTHAKLHLLNPVYNELPNITNISFLRYSDLL